VIVIEIPASDRVHETAAHDCYLRIGDESRKLGPFETQELRFDKGESTYDGGPVPGVGIDALDSALVSKFVDAVRGAVRSEVALRSRGLVVERDGGLVPTVAGILILGREPQAHLPNATVRLLRYQGSSRETGARSNIRDDVRLDGTLPSMIATARRRLRRWLPSAGRLAVDGRFDGTGTLVPEPAWLESIVNAVTHRSYTISDHVRVELFEDRLEVESPGRLPGLVRPDNIRSTRFARNPRVARALADLRYGRELGEGVNRMFEEMERAGLPDPIFAQTAGSVKVTFLADPLSARVLALLPVGSERFVEAMSRTGRITTSQAMELLGASRPTVVKYLHRLETAGLAEAVRMSPKDPRGFWRLRRAGHDA
jgi:ATP-dependent DNA helicase RecG